jgi:hypothetical protein
VINFSFCSTLYLKHHGTTSSSHLPSCSPWKQYSIDLVSCRKCSSCSSLTSLRFSGKKSKCKCRKWTLSDMLQPISLHSFRSFWVSSLKSGISFYPLKVFSGCSFYVSQTFYTGFIFQDFSDSRSHEDAFFQFCSANFVKIFTQVLESFWIVLAMAFTKILINTRFMYKGGRNIFMGLTKGMCWTLSFPGS